MLLMKQSCKAKEWQNCIEVSIIIFISELNYFCSNFTKISDTLFSFLILYLFSDTLFSFLILFLLVPLVSPILDIVHPLNQTRSRQQLLRVNYIIFDTDDYFFYVYLQLAWGSIIVVLTIIAADWFYILIIHFNSGLFAVCG